MYIWWGQISEKHGSTIPLVVSLTVLSGLLQGGGSCGIDCKAKLACTKQQK
jgi:hypothetical protein